jgi:hypothetical protein
MKFTTTVKRFKSQSWLYGIFVDAEKKHRVYIGKVNLYTEMMKDSENLVLI